MCWRSSTSNSSNGTLLGVIVQFGGQTPLKLRDALEAADVPILGTSPDAIDLAEDRERFQQLLDKLKLQQPKNGIADSVPRRRAPVADDDRLSARGPPVLCAGRPGHGDHPRRSHSSTLCRHCRLCRRSSIRPRSELYGARQAAAADRPLSEPTPSRSMSIAWATARTPSSPASWSISRKPASTPAIQRLLAAAVFARRRDDRRNGAADPRAGARRSTSVGLMNVQYAIKDGDIYVLEVNPRASRTVPFVAKVIGMPVAKIAARIMAGENAGELQA